MIGAMAVLLFTTLHATVTLSWQAPAVGCEDTCVYRVYRLDRPGACGENRIGMTDQLAFIDDVKLGDLWYYAVSAVNGAGDEGPCSEEVGVRVQRLPGGAWANLYVPWVGVY